MLRGVRCYRRPGEVAVWSSNRIHVAALVVEPRRFLTRFHAWTDGREGSVTITSLTADRVKGTFSATLRPVPGKPATTPLTVASGTFDVGLD